MHEAGGWRIMSEIKKTVLIGDCSYGFTRKAALFLKANGWHVYAAARHEKDIDFLKTKGIESFRLDFTSSDSIKTVIKDVLERCQGDLKGLVLYVGHTQIGAVEDLTREAMRKQFEMSVFGPVELASFIIPIFRQKNYGRIIFVNTLNGTFTFPFMGTYGAARHAFEAFFVATRRELRNTGIKATCIIPYCLKQDTDERVEIIRTRDDREHIDYRDTYRNMERLIDDITDAHASEKRTMHTAYEVLKALESKNPRRRVVIGWHAKLRDIAHSLLSGRLQDYVLYLKMKYVYKIL